jgi:hypothetical protein
MRSLLFKTNPLVIIAAVSVIIFSLVGISAITGDIPAVNSETSEPAARGKLSGIKLKITPKFLEKRASAQKVEQPKPCANCAVVDSIIVNEVKGDSGGVDRVASGVASGKTAATSAYQVKVRMDDGTYRVITQQDQPVFHVGEKVKIVNGMVVQLEGTAMMDKNRILALMLAALTGRIF